MQSHRLLVECGAQQLSCNIRCCFLNAEKSVYCRKKPDQAKNQNRRWECVSPVKYQHSQATGRLAGRSGWQRFFPSQAARAAASTKALSELPAAPVSWAVPAAWPLLATFLLPRTPQLLMASSSPAAASPPPGIQGSWTSVFRAYNATAFLCSRLPPPLSPQQIMLTKLILYKGTKESACDWYTILVNKTHTMVVLVGGKKSSTFCQS